MYPGAQAKIRPFIHTYREPRGMRIATQVGHALQRPLDPVAESVRNRLTAGGDWIRTSSTRAREVGDRAPTAAKSNGSTKPLSMRIGDLRSARTPHQGPGGQGHRRARPLGRGPHRGCRFIARDRARYRYYEGSRSDPAVTACQHYFKNCGFSRDVMRQSSRAVLRQRSNGVRSCLRG